MHYNYFSACFLVVPRVSFVHDMYNGTEGMIVKICSVLSNELARQATVQLTVDNSVAGYDDAESKYWLYMFSPR